MIATGIESVLQVLVAGLLVGAIYGLMCVGLAMIFGVMRVINFAQGDFMMLGMYAAYYLFVGVGLPKLFGASVAPYVGALIVGPLVFALGYGVHYALVSRVSGARASALGGEGHYAQLILTLGIALILQDGVLLLFGSSTASVRTPLSIQSWEIGPLWADQVSIFVNKARAFGALAACSVIAVVATVMSRTRIGKNLRAAADNPVAATYMGIDVDRAHRVAFGVGVGISAIAGALLATSYPFHPFVGLDYVIIMYTGVVLGGMGSVFGAFLGGMTIGLVQQLSTLVLPTTLQNTAIFIIFLLIIFFRPQGFFGRTADRT